MTDNKQILRKKFKSVFSSYSIIVSVIVLLLAAFSGFRNGTKQDISTPKIISVSDTSITNKNKPGKKFEAKLDGDELYRQNCNRCHQPPQRFSKEKFMTILKHMRTIANFTEDEQNSLLEFLTR